MNGGALMKCCRRLICSSTVLRRSHKTPNAYAPQTSSYSPLESKIHKMLSSEIQYQFDYAPPHQPLAEYDRFMIEDRPGELWITLRGKSDEEENIKIEATMFDGFAGAQDNVRLHISMLIDIWKGEGTSAIKFVCSAWPNSLEIQKVFIYYRKDESPDPFYVGPHFKNLNTKLQTGFYQFLNARGLNDDLSMFLHKYMMNKDRIELIQWLGKVNCFLNK